MTRSERRLAAVLRYNARNPDLVKARWKAYREANRARLLAYQKEYRDSRGPEETEKLKVYMKEYNRAYYGKTPRPKRVRSYTPKPQPILVPRDPSVVKESLTTTKIISMYVSCSYCESKFRRGTPEYYDGTFDRGEFCCGQCGENLELEA